MADIDKINGLIDEIDLKIFELNQGVKAGEPAQVTAARNATRNALLSQQRRRLRQLLTMHRVAKLNNLAAEVEGWTEALEREQVERTLKGFADSIKAAVEIVARSLREMEMDPPEAGVAPAEPKPPALRDPAAVDPSMLRLAPSEVPDPVPAPSPAPGAPAPERPSVAARVYGHVVRRLQARLTDLGFDTQGVDMVFGDDTAEALAAWHAAVGGRDTGALTFAEWDLLGAGARPDLFDLCAQVAAAFEGHGFGKAVGDFDGAVFTWGYHGYTVKFGHAQAVLARAEAMARGTLSAAFGSKKAAALRRMLRSDLDKQIAWARRNLLDNGGPDPDWVAGFRALGETEVGRAAQLAHSREAFWERIALPQAERLGLTEPLSRAQLFDTAIQQGGLGRAAMALIEAAFDAEPDLPENEKRRIVAREAANAISSGRFRGDVLSRRMTFVNGDGVVHGKRYELSDWGLCAAVDESESRLDEHPVAAPRPGLPEAPADFQTWYAAQVKDRAESFEAKEFLVLGAQHVGGGPCHGLNTLPPAELWPNMIPLAITLEAFRRTMGAPVRILCAYRSEDYNACVGGAERSQHRLFKAADIVCEAGDPGRWRTVLRELRSRGVFSGGIGVYGTFVHVDVRDSPADWRG